MEQKILSEIYRAQQLMGVEKRILSEDAISPKPYIEVTQDFFQKLYQKNKSVADDILSDYLTRIGKTMSDDLIERIMRGELAQDLSEIEAKGLLEAIEAATKRSSAYKSAINDTFKETISEKAYYFAKIVLNKIGNQISTLETRILNKEITQEQANKFYRDSIDSINKTYPGIYNEIKKQIEERIGRSIDEIANYEKTNIRSRLKDLAQKAKSNANNFWDTKGQFLNMSGTEYLRYWKYTRFVNDLILFYEKQLKKPFTKSSNLDEKINEYFSFLETEVPLLFNSVVEKWSNDLSTNTQAFIKLNEYSEFFRRMMTKFESLSREVSSHSEDDIERLIDVFKENPQFAKLSSEQQELMLKQLREELTKLNPGTQSWWIRDIIGDTVLKNMWDEIWPLRKESLKSIPSNIQRYANSLIYGTFKNGKEYKLFKKEYNQLFPLFQNIQMPGFKNGVNRFTRYTTLMFVSHFVFPLVWGLVKGILMPVIQFFDGFLGNSIPPNLDYDDPNKNDVVVYVNQIIETIKDSFSVIWSPVTIFGESATETEKWSADWVATACKWLIPAPIGDIGELYDFVVGGIAYLGGKGWETDYNKAQEELRQKIEEYKSQGIDAIKNRMGELERLGQVGSDEYKALKQALEELENNQQNGGDSNQNGGNQNGGGGAAPVVDPNPGEEIQGLEQEMKNAFNSWAANNANRNPSWVEYNNDTGYVMVDGRQYMLKRTNANKLVILTTPNPTIIN